MPFEGEARKPTYGDIVYGLATPRDIFWNRYNRRTKTLFLMEEFDIINGESPSYGFSGDTSAFKAALALHPKYSSAIMADGATKRLGDASKPNVNSDIRRKDKGGIVWTVNSSNPQRHLHFILDEIDLKQVVGKSSPNDNSKTGEEKVRGITGSELRWIYRNRSSDNVKNRIQFWKSELVLIEGMKNKLPVTKASVPPWHPSYVDIKYPPSIWNGYNPKSLQLD